VWPTHKHCYCPKLALSCIFISEHGLRIITISCNTLSLSVADCKFLTATRHSKVTRLHLFDRLYLVGPSRRCLCLKCLLCLSHLSRRVADRTSAILRLLRNLWTCHFDLLLASLHANYARHIALDQRSPNCGPQSTGVREDSPWGPRDYLVVLHSEGKCFIPYICSLI